MPAFILVHAQAVVISVFKMVKKPELGGVYFNYIKMDF